MYYYVIQFNIYPQWLLTPIPTIWCRSYSGRNNTPQGQMMAVSVDYLWYLILLIYHKAPLSYKILFTSVFQP